MATKYITHGCDLVGRAGHLYRVSDDEKSMHLEESIRILNNGHVGIGKIPSVELDVAGTLDATVIKVGGVDVLTGYTETDPIFTAWDKSSGISITESQISDLAHTPVFDGDIAEVYNSLGLFKIQPDAQGDVELFGDTQVGDGSNSPYFYLHRKAAEGNDYIRFFINSSRRGYIHGSPPGGLYMQGQTDMALVSVTEDVILRVGDAAGVKKLRIQDSGGVDVATIDSDGNTYFSGNVGIGTINPLGKFHISPSWDETEGIVLETDGSDDNTGGYLQFRERGDNFYGAEFGYKGSGGSNRAYIGVRDNSTVLNEVISILRSNGNVGIGTSNPIEPLTIDVGASSYGGIEITNSSSGGGAQTGLILKTVDSSNKVGTAGTYGWQLVARSDTFNTVEQREDLRLEYYDNTAWKGVVFFEHDTGNIGIGTDTPGLPLDIRSADDNQMFAFDTRAQAQGVGGGIAFGGKYTDAGGEAMAGRIGTKKTNGTSGHVGFDMVFETQNSVGSITDRMILTSDGKVGIGDIIPLSALDVDGNVRIRGDLSNVVNVNMSGDLTSDGTLMCVDIETSGNIGAGKASPTFRIDAYINRTSGIVRSGRFQVDGNHTDARGLYVLAGEDTESGTNYWFEAYDGDGGINTGGLRSVAGVFDVYNASDERLKQNIKDTRIVGKDIILGLKVRDFEWKRNPKHQVTGLIAQEVLAICPDAIGKPDPETGMYGMSKTVLIPHLIKHNQEQQSELDNLKARMTKLEKITTQN